MGWFWFSWLTSNARGLFHHLVNNIDTPKVTCERKKITSEPRTSFSRRLSSVRLLFDMASTVYEMEIGSDPHSQSGLSRRRYIAVLEALKAHFHPRCNARLDLISCNTKFPDNLKLSKIVFLKSHHGHIVNCFTVNIFTVRHFTISLQYFEFCREESEENFFKCHAWISSYSVNRVGEKDNVQIFSLSRSAWAF